MALNPPISQNGLPLRVEGEFMVLERKNIECEFKIDRMDKKKTGKGKLYLTTCRLVFVHNDFLKNEFNSFDIPLAFLYKEKFEQPIFGSNYLAGSVKPLYNLLPGDTQFKLWFTSGGCNTFLKLFCYVLDQVRKQSALRRGPDQAFLDSVRLGQLGQNVAFVDPNDPTIIYVSQPQETFESERARATGPYDKSGGTYVIGSDYQQNPASQPFQPSFQQAPSYQSPPSFQQPPISQQGPVYQQGPGYQQPPSYQQAPSYQGYSQPPANPYNDPNFQTMPSSQTLPSSQQQIPSFEQQQAPAQPSVNANFYLGQQSSNSATYYGFGLGPQLQSNR